MKQILICPSCGNPVSDKFSKNACRYCGAFLKHIEKDVYSFLKNNYYWGEIPPHDMQEVLIQSKRKGWKFAVQELVKTYPKMEEYLLNHARIDWIFHCLPLTPKGRALDIGSGWGGLACDLTKFFDEVYSLEAVKERFEFQRIRKSQEKLKNLKLIQGNFLKLPFANDSFDLIAVNGVMEWAGIADYTKPAPEVQKEFLKEIYRVLKPGGVVYVGIENRFGLHYFLGAEDHSGLPFTSLMPRFLAGISVRFLRKTEGKYKLSIRMSEEWQNYRTYTYTLDGYKKLFSSCNFKKVQPYWTLFYSNPKFSGPIDGASFKYFLRYISDNTSGGKISLGGLISKIGNHAPEWFCKQMAQWFAPSFLLYAYKSKPGVSLEAKLRSLAKPHTSFLKMGGSSADTSKINYFLLNKGKLVEVIKFARFPDASLSIAEESKLAVKYGNTQIEKNKKLTNRLVIFDKPLSDKHLSPGNLNDVSRSLDWLFEFQTKTTFSVNSAKLISNDISNLLAKISQLPLTKKQAMNVGKHLNKFDQLVKTTSLPVCSAHGDFCARNILSSKNEIKVLDWEDFINKTTPLHDFMFFVIHSLAHMENSNQIPSSINNYYTNDFLQLSFEKFCKKYNVEMSVLTQSLGYIAMWYLDRFHKNNKHIGHGDFYFSILKNLKQV